METDKQEEINKRLEEARETEDNIEKYQNFMGNDKVRQVLGECYEDIIAVLKEYCDLNEDYYPLIAIWIIGTYIHKSFETYPYLFINAMRGTGKTRLLKLIAKLSWNGDILTSLKEAVLFRTASQGTICIDEFEGLNKKENAPLRELLNAAYKKGIKVKRMKKIKTAVGESQMVEEFSVYTPICMANIWGMEEVLGDRCISLVLEKSSNSAITMLMEDFESSVVISDIKNRLSTLGVVWCSYFGKKQYIEKWNIYIKSLYTTLTTHTTQRTETTLTTPLKQDKTTFLEQDNLLDMFNRIYAAGINGRNLELVFPLLLVSDFLGEEVFTKLLEVSKIFTKQKKDDEMMESRDVSLMDYISTTLNASYISIKKLTNAFRIYVGDDEDSDEKWLNSKWMGRALKRLNLILDKKRLGEGVEVRLNIAKALEKLRTIKGER